MVYTIIGLGNPVPEYLGTRHNVGKDIVEFIKLESGKFIKSLKFVEGECYMNESGSAVVKSVKSVKSKAVIEGLVIVHDDLDLPLGKMRISFGKSAGGHRGVQSVIDALGTSAFTRIRIGISPTTPSGKLKKPKGEEKVVKFILGKFSADEKKTLKKVEEKVSEAIEMIASGGRERAMNVFNR